jgi:hypothetical protein
MTRTQIEMNALRQDDFNRHSQRTQSLSVVGRHKKGLAATGVLASMIAMTGVKTASAAVNAPFSYQVSIGTSTKQVSGCGTQSIISGTYGQAFPLGKLNAAGTQCSSGGVSGTGYVFSATNSVISFYVNNPQMNNGQQIVTCAANSPCSYPYR